MGEECPIDGQAYNDCDQDRSGYNWTIELPELGKRSRKAGTMTALMIDHRQGIAAFGAGF
jgi:hypothetical protein